MRAMMSSDNVDQKYYGTVRKMLDSTVVPSNELIIFRAKDNAVPAMLDYYEKECERIGCSAEHMRRVGELISRVAHWRSENAGKCKEPD